MPQAVSSIYFDENSPPVAIAMWLLGRGKKSKQPLSFWMQQQILKHWDGAEDDMQRILPEVSTIYQAHL